MSKRSSTGYLFLLGQFHLLLHPDGFRTLVNAILSAKNLSGLSGKSAESFLQIASIRFVGILLIKGLSMVDKTSSFSESLLELRQLIFLNSVHQRWVSWHWNAKLLSWRLSIQNSSINFIVPVHTQHFVHDFRLLFN